MITKNRTWLLLVPVLALLISCGEKLDIEPKQSIDADVALTTPENIQTTLVGAYLTARRDERYLELVGKVSVCMT